MPVRRWLLLAFAVFAAVHVAGVLSGTRLLPSAGLLAWVTLCVYTVIAGRDAPRRTRVALVAGLVIFGGLAAAEAFAEPVGYGWFAYTPQAEVAFTTAWWRGLREIGPQLIGYACLTVAAFALVRRASGRAGRFVAIGGTAVALVWAALLLWSRADGVLEWLAYSAALLPPAALAVAAFVVAGRVAARPLACAGLALVGLAAMTLYDGAVSTMWQWGDTLGGFGYYEVMAAVAGPEVGGTDWWEVTTVIAPLIAAAAVTVGCLARPRP